MLDIGFKWELGRAMATMSDICENTKLGRESALLGNYESAQVYYQCVLQQIDRLLKTVKHPSRREHWEEVNRIERPCPN